jgi:hypothetical protein
MTTEDTENKQEIEPLEGPAAVERVIELGKARIYKARAVLVDFVANGDGYRLATNARIVCENPIPVYEEDGLLVCGFAEVYADGQQIIADMTFDYGTPSRLLSQIDEPVYAVPGGDYFVDVPGMLCDYVAFHYIELSRQPGAFYGGRLENLTHE